MLIHCIPLVIVAIALGIRLYFSKGFTPRNAIAIERLTKGDSYILVDYSVEYNCVLMFRTVSALHTLKWVQLHPSERNARFEPRYVYGGEYIIDERSIISTYPNGSLYVTPSIVTLTAFSDISIGRYTREYVP